MSYWALVATKNGEDTISICLESILSQNLPPRLICTVDDGSTDKTAQILESFSEKLGAKMRIVALPDRGYDIRRTVHNFNIGIKEVRKLGIKTRYTMISGDDCLYPDDYAEFIVARMDEDPSVVVASGDITGSCPDESPRGSGRFIRNSFFEEIGNEFPPYYGYEGWIVHKALQLGYEIRNFAELRYGHLRELGRDHKFSDWGLAMKCLGYHPLEVLYRCVRYVFVDRRVPPAYLRILWDYFIRPIGLQNDPYFHYFDEDLRNYIRERQRQRLCRVVLGHS